jgi:hypothetical protein
MGMGFTSFADDKGTVIPSSAKIRASADASSEQLGSVEQGDSVDIIAKTTGADGSTWYQVYVDANTKGYIRADLVKAEGTGTISEASSTATDQSVTQVTAVDAKKCTVSQNSVRIRKGASTNHDVVATANRGMTLTITGEATGSDGKTWYQVTFTYNSNEITGFIRSDLVTFDSISDDPATAQITGEGAEVSTEMQTEDETLTQEEQESSDNGSQGIVLMNVDEVPYILPGFSAVSLSWNDESIKAYSNGGFYLFYARMENGDEGWYVFDSEKGEYQRYVYTASSSATVPSSSEGVGIIPVIILVVIIIILAAIIGLLLIRLKDASYSDEYDDYKDDDEEDDLKFEEIESRYSNRQQIQRQQYQASQNSQPQTRRPVQTTQGQNGQQVRRPVQATQGQASVNGQQVRRPVQVAQGQASVNGQQVRRPVQTMQGQAGVNGQQVRRPVQTTQGQNGQQVRRPVQATQQTSQSVPQNQTQQRPTASQASSTPQQGYKAKAILDNQDDDMEFIDL